MSTHSSAGGVAEVFTPGSPLATITDWLEAALDDRESTRAEAVNGK